jgi:hypothetical protein
LFVLFQKIKKKLKSVFPSFLNNKKDEWALDDVCFIFILLFTQWFFLLDEVGLLKFLEFRFLTKRKNVFLFIVFLSTEKIKQLHTNKESLRQ